MGRYISPFSYFVFFFQAEDGIRDHCVTGVQTCALPISSSRNRDPRAARSPCPARQWRSSARARRSFPQRTGASSGVPPRSEERRVGKECRSWWLPYHEKKKRTSRKICES